MERKGGSMVKLLLLAVSAMVGGAALFVSLYGISSALVYFSPIFVGMVVGIIMYKHSSKKSSSGVDRGRKLMDITLTPWNSSFGKKLLLVLVLGNCALVVVSMYLLGGIGAITVIAPLIILLRMSSGNKIPVYEKGIVGAGGWGEFISWKDIKEYRFEEGKVIFLIKDGRKITYPDSNRELHRIANMYLKGLCADVKGVQRQKTYSG